MQKVNLKIASIVLLLLFTQNLGIQLWIHDHFHEKISSTASDTNLKVDCHCLDDVFTPMSPSFPLEVAVLIKSFTHIRYEYVEYFISAQKNFHSLRGPPQGA
jgi:hypothetical protein